MSSPSPSPELQYSYASKPRPVQSARSKPIRDSSNQRVHEKEYAKRVIAPNIMYDPRVVRGSVFAAHQFAISGQSSTGKTRRRVSKRRGNRDTLKKSGKSLYEAMTVPSYSFSPMSLDAYLVEKEVPRNDRESSSQTDEFKPINTRNVYPRRAMADGVYDRQKVGIDSTTQVEPSDNLFNFDTEVQPLLDVLVSKTIAQALVEVNEEQEMHTIQVERAMLKEQKEIQRQADRELENKAKEAEREKKRVMEERKEQQRRRDRLNKKVVAWQLARKAVTGVFQAAHKMLYDRGVFYNPVEREFSRWLASEVYPGADAKLRLKQLSCTLLDDILAASLQKQALMSFLMPGDFEALVRFLLKEPICRPHQSQASQEPQETQEVQEVQAVHDKEESLSNTIDQDGAATETETEEVSVIGPILISRWDSLDRVEQKIQVWIKENIGSDLEIPFGGFLSMVDLSGTSTST